MMLFSCKSGNQSPPTHASALPVVNSKINGLTLVAPPDSFSSNPMVPIKAVGANWIAVVPYAFTRPGQAKVHYNSHGHQWWGERPEGVLATIRTAHKSGVKVMLKPQVWIPRGWTGTLDFDSKSEWEAWEADYMAYVLPMARMAEEEHVDLFCFGTELRNAISKRPSYWLDLIDTIRTVYSGDLVYSANWDDWEQVPFWDKMDYIGLSAYFPLMDSDTPVVDSLCKAWMPVKKRLKKFSQQYNKPVLFTEFGYLSVDGSGGKTWELENGIKHRAVNQKAQANCLDALFHSYYPETWWAGGFLWKWFPEMKGHEGYPERDYTPQGKMAESVLEKWYRQPIGLEK
jgi:hypothetical protein